MGHNPHAFSIYALLLTDLWKKQHDQDSYGAYKFVLSLIFLVHLPSFPFCYKKFRGDTSNSHTQRRETELLLQLL